MQTSVLNTESQKYLGLVEGELCSDPGALGVRTLGGRDGQKSGQDENVAVHDVGREIRDPVLLYQSWRKPAPRARCDI